MTTTREALKQAMKAINELFNMSACSPKYNAEFVGRMEGRLSMLNAALAAANAEEAKPAPVTCGQCHGSGWMVRDPDIGTDQECFVCEGAGQFEGVALPAPVDAQCDRDATKGGRYVPVAARDAARVRALEDAAKVCDSVNNHDNPMTNRDCADTIRAMMKPQADGIDDLNPYVYTFAAKMLEFPREHAFRDSLGFSVGPAQPASGAVDERDIVDDALAKVGDLGTVGAMKWLAAALSASNQVNAAQPDDLSSAIERGTKAWANTPAGWVDDLRGGEPVAQIGSDAERLEWIERKLFHQQWNGVIGSDSKTSWHIWGGYRHITQAMIGDTFKQAIDAAIAAQQQHQGGSNGS